MTRDVSPSGVGAVVPSMSDTGRVRAVGGFLLLLMAMQASAQHSYGVLAPWIRSDLAASQSQMGLVAGALYLGTATAAFAFGGWVDRRRPRTVLAATAGGMGAALSIVASAPALLLVLVGYMLVGLGRGAVPPLGDRLAYEGAPPAHRGSVFGIKQTGTPVASVLTALGLPVVAGGVLGWRAAVMTTATVVVVSGFLLWRVLPRTFPDPPPPTVAEAPVRERSGLPPGLLTALRPAMVFSLGLGVFMSCAMTFLTLFLVDAGGFEAARAARWFAVYGVGGACGRVAWGWLSDRAFGGRRAVVLLLTAVIGGGLAIVLGLFTDAMLAAPYGLSMAVFGFVTQGWVGIVRALGSELAGPGMSGRAGGLLLGAMMVGGLVGPPLFGWLADVTGGYRVGWVLMGALSVGAGLAVLPVVRRERRPVP